MQVSEHASWSSRYYGRIIAAALAAVRAPPDLVQIVTGYADAGQALVTGGVDKLIFVGSTEVRPWRSRLRLAGEHLRSSAQGHAMNTV